MAWDKELTPVATYDALPVNLLPENNVDDVDADEFFNLMQDVYNRLEFLNGASTTNTTHIDNIALGSGLSKTDTVVPTYSSGNLLTSAVSLKGAVEILDTGILSNTTTAGHISTNVGGGVETAGLNIYSSTNVVVNGETHHTSIGKLDNQVGVNTTTSSGAAVIASNNASSIINIANKVGDNAEIAGVGFTYDSTSFIANGDKLKIAAEKLDAPLGAYRRILERLYEQTVLNWRDISFGEFGGATPDNYFFETLVNTSKIDVGNSTAGAHNVVKQQFGDPNAAWTYITNIVPIPGTTDEIKMKFSVLGTVTISVNFQGSLVSGFVSITDEDVFVSVPAGSQMIIKFEGGAGTYLYNYAVVYKG